MKQLQVAAALAAGVVVNAQRQQQLEGESLQPEARLHSNPHIPPPSPSPSPSAPQPPQQGYGGYHQGGYTNGGGYGGGGMGREEGPSTVVKLRGLPFSAAKEDIIHWFSDVQVTPPTEEG